MDGFRWRMFVRTRGHHLTWIQSAQITAISYWATQLNFFAREYRPRTIEALRERGVLQQSAGPAIQLKSLVMVAWLSIITYASLGWWIPFILSCGLALLSFSDRNWKPLLLGHLGSLASIGASIGVGYQLCQIFNWEIPLLQAMMVFSTATLVAYLNLTPGSVGVAELTTASLLDSDLGGTAWLIAVIHRLLCWYWIVFLGLAVQFAFHHRGKSAHSEQAQNLRRA